MDKREIINMLTAELSKMNEQRRISAQDAQSAIHAQIAQLDATWSETERKHQSAMSWSTSDSWSRSLLSAHGQRREKYEVTRSNLLAYLSEHSVDAPLISIDFEAVLRFLDAIMAEISKHEPTLAVKRRQLELVGDYGHVEREKWLAEILRFIAKNPTVATSIRAIQAACGEAAPTFDWNGYVACRVDEVICPAANLPEPVKSDGIAFEHACLAALVHAGWEGSLTKSTGDQGVDIIARKNDRSIAVQCKNYKAPVGNGAVQEVHSGKAFYEADWAIVVSPSGFTDSAIQLANKLGVLLIDPSFLGSLDERL
jgi:restriction system protein